MTIDWLVVSVIMNILGILWSAYREMLIYDLSRRLSQLGTQVIQVVQGGTSALEKLQFSLESSRGDRLELMHTLRALEDRLSSLIRDVRGAVNGVTVIANRTDSTNFGGSVNQANVNSGNGTQHNQ